MVRLRLFRTMLGAAQWGLVVLLLAALADAEAKKPERKASSPVPAAPEVQMVPSAAFDRARSYYRAGLFDECVERYQELFQQGEDSLEEVPVETVEQGRLYYSSCLSALGRDEEAEEQMRKAMHENPLMEAPDPIVFPRQVQDLFFKVKADFLDAVVKAQEAERLKAEAIAQARAARQRREQERVKRLEELAAQETLVARNERWIAAIPFGVGQFQNGDNTLGAVFLASETLLLAATISAVAIQLDTHSQADGGNDLTDATPFNTQGRLAHTVELASGASFLLLAGVGILEAQVNFVPEKRLGTRRRPIPKSDDTPIQIQPTVTPGPRSTLFGLSGTF